MVRETPGIYTSMTPQDAYSLDIQRGRDTNRECHVAGRTRSVCWSIEVWDRSAIKVHTKGRKEIHSPQLSWPRAPRSQEEKVRHLDTKYFGGILYTDRLSKCRNSSPYPTQFWV